MAKRKRRLKGYTRAGQFGSRGAARAKASSLRGKFRSVLVRKGTVGAAWGRPRTVYRVWVK